MRGKGCGKEVSERGVEKGCQKGVSKRGVRKRCRKGVSERGVGLWNPGIQSLVSITTRPRLFVIADSCRIKGTPAFALI